MIAAAKFASAATVLANLEVFVQYRGESSTPVKQMSVHISGQDVPDCPCHLIGIDAGVLFVRSERQIPESSAIIVSLDHVQLSGVVAGCQAAKNDWVISIGLSSSRRRLAGAIPHGQEAGVGILESDRTGLRPCAVINSSSYGLALRLGFAIPTGARVCVALESMMIFGEIRHCNPKPNGERIAGMLIIDVVPDVRHESPFSVMLNNLRWKLASSIRGRDVPAYRSDR